MHQILIPPQSYKNILTFANLSELFRKNEAEKCYLSRSRANSRLCQNVVEDEQGFQVSQAVVGKGGVGWVDGFLGLLGIVLKQGVDG